MKPWDSWQVYALMIFAVAAGQIGRLGQNLERGTVIGPKQVLVELSMLPAFGSLGGALAVARHWPEWAILVVGISAGWLGFATFRLIVAVFRTLAKQFAADNSPD